MNREDYTKEQAIIALNEERIHFLLERERCLNSMLYAALKVMSVAERKVFVSMIPHSVSENTQIFDDIEHIKKHGTCPNVEDGFELMVKISMGK